MLEIINQPEGEIGIKRFEFEGLVMYYSCPICGESHIWNNYLYYPKINVPIDLPLYCRKCDHEWIEQIILKVNVEIV